MNVSLKKKAVLFNYLIIKLFKENYIIIITKIIL